MNINLLFNDFCKVLQNCKQILTEDSIRYYFYGCMLKQDSFFYDYTMELPYQEIATNKSLPISLIPNHGLFYNSYKQKGGGMRTQLNQELDLYYNNGTECYCIEVKFHHDSPNSEYAHTSAAGELFNDIRRLQTIVSSSGRPIRKFLVYVADDIMWTYLSGKPSGINNQKAKAQFQSFIKPDPKININLTYPKDAPKSFREASLKSFDTNPLSSTRLTNLGLNAVLQVIGADDFPTACPSMLNCGKGGYCHIRMYEIL